MGSYGLIRRAFGYINERSPVLVSSPRHRPVGHSAEEIFYGLLKAKRERKRVLFIYPRPLLFRKLSVTVGNRELFHMRSDLAIPSENKIGVLAGMLLTVLYASSVVLQRLVTSLVRGPARRFWPRGWGREWAALGSRSPDIGRAALWNPQGVQHFSWDIVASMRWEESYAGYVPPTLTPDRLLEAQAQRVELGIPLADWFVCLHVSNRSPGSARGGSVENYVDGIHAIAAAGGWVVRIGDPSMPPLPRMARVVDYAVMPKRSALLNVYLLSQCRFFVGTNSGPKAIAELFRKKNVSVNLSDWSTGCPPWSGDLCIIKHVFSRSRGRFLSVKEIVEEPFTVQAFAVAADDYIFVENTPEEIRDVIQEALEQPPGDRYEYSDLQQMFNEARSRQIEQGLDAKEPHQHFRHLSPSDYIVEQYRLASRIKGWRGSVGRRYLQQYWEQDQTPEPLAEHVQQLSRFK